MEKEGHGYNKIQLDSFQCTLIKAQNGDKEAMMKIINLMEPDIKLLSKYIKLPKDDAIQTLKAELIDIVKNKIGSR